MNCFGYVPSTNHCIESVTYVINENPASLHRARVNFTSRRVYDSQKQLKLLMGINLRNQHGDDPPYSGILHLDVEFAFALPANKQQRRSRSSQHYHIQRPDLSNLLKMIEDVCVDCGIIKDDALIASIHSQKVYAQEPKTTFKFYVLENNGAV